MTTPLTDEQIAKLRELRQKSTGGRWYVGKTLMGDPVIRIEIDDEINGRPLIRATDNHFGDEKADLQIAAESFNALPALLDEVERLRKLQLAARNYLDAWITTEELGEAVTKASNP